MCIFIVKSKTVWIGHIMKGVDEEQLSKMLERYGAVTSIDVSVFIESYYTCTWPSVYGGVCISNVIPED